MPFVIHEKDPDQKQLVAKSTILEDHKNNQFYPTFTLNENKIKSLG